MYIYRCIHMYIYIYTYIYILNLIHAHLNNSAHWKSLHSQALVLASLDQQ